MASRTAFGVATFGQKTERSGIRQTSYGKPKELPEDFEFFVQAEFLVAGDRWDLFAHALGSDLAVEGHNAPCGQPPRIRCPSRKPSSSIPALGKEQPSIESWDARSARTNDVFPL